MPPLTGPRDEATRSRLVAFATFYSQTGNARASALKAGYSATVAAKQTKRLLGKRTVRDILESLRISRTVHGEETYRHLIAVANIAMKTLQATMANPAADMRDKALIIETTGRALERLAKVEGLMSGDTNVTVQPRGNVNVQVNVAALQQPERLREVLDLARAAGVLDVLFPQPKIEELPGPMNGNGNGVHDA